MFQRNISTDDVEFVLLNSEIIKEYPDDKPYPSKLLLAFPNERPLHVVCSFNPVENRMIIITAYEPTLDIWVNNYKKKKKE